MTSVTLQQLWFRTTRGQTALACIAFFFLAIPRITFAKPNQMQEGNVFSIVTLWWCSYPMIVRKSFSTKEIRGQRVKGRSLWPLVSVVGHTSEEEEEEPGRTQLYTLRQQQKERFLYLIYRNALAPPAERWEPAVGGGGASVHVSVQRYVETVCRRPPEDQKQPKSTINECMN